MTRRYRARASWWAAMPLAAAAGAATPAAGQSVQYRSAAGVEYRAQRDTGPIARAESALAAEPRSVARIIEHGVAQSGARQYREAIETFSRGLALAPDDAMLYRWRGHRYLSVREFDRAREDLTRGSRLDSANYAIWYHLGIVRYVAGDFAGAADAFARAQPRAPDRGEAAGAADWLWMSLSRAGKTAEARAVLDRLPDSLPPGNAYTRRLRLYREEIGPDDVITAVDTGDIAVATLSYGVGNWYLVRGDTARARSWFARSVGSGGWPAFGFIAAEIELRRLPQGAVGNGFRAAASDTLLEGAFRWTTLNGQPAPLEFPPGSGATLMAGTLELRGLGEAIRAGAGRFGLRFTSRSQGDTARVTGQGGRFHIAGDSLLFTPDGREDRPPVRFRYAWRSDGSLALTDAQGHVWSYVRQ